MASMTVIVYPNHGNHIVVCSTTSEDFLKMVNLGGTNPQKARPLLGPDVGPVLEDVSAVLLWPNFLLRLSNVCDGQTPAWTPTHIVQFQVLKESSSIAEQPSRVSILLFVKSRGWRETVDMGRVVNLISQITGFQPFWKTRPLNVKKFWELVILISVDC